MIRTGDHVLHKPSGETWVVAFERDGELCACGWPCSIVPTADCEIVKEATDDEHMKLLVDLANMSDKSDPRCAFAQRELLTNTQ